ncbi:hypothetical protein H9P43_008973 [Blastocladiella emersonii ATCC 22665]|nr:hypothetical protein H9P43_008973 [Blastocladiella emersonii ATCC 22665]
MPPSSPANTGLPPQGAQRISRVRAALVALHEAYPNLAFDVTTDGSLLVESRADGERPMECPFPGCRQRFKRRRANDVARHFQTRHAPDALPFVCPAPCTSRTNRRDHFATHLKRSEPCVWRLLVQRTDPDVDIMMTMAAQSGAFGAAGHWTELLAAAHELDLATIPTTAPLPAPALTMQEYTTTLANAPQLPRAANVPALEWHQPPSHPPLVFSGLPPLHAPSSHDAGPAYPAGSHAVFSPAMDHHRHHHHHCPGFDASAAAGYPARVPSRYSSGTPAAAHHQQRLISSVFDPATLTWGPATVGVYSAAVGAAPLDSSAWSDSAPSDGYISGGGFLATLARLAELQRPQPAEPLASTANGPLPPHVVAPSTASHAVRVE